MAKLLQKRSDPFSIMICKSSNGNKQACEMLSEFHVTSINFLMKYSMYLYFSVFFFPLPVQMYSYFVFFFLSFTSTNVLLFSVF